MPLPFPCCPQTFPYLHIRTASRNSSLFHSSPVPLRSCSASLLLPIIACTAAVVFCITPAANHRMYRCGRVLHHSYCQSSHVPLRSCSASLLLPIIACTAAVVFCITPANHRMYRCGRVLHHSYCQSSHVPLRSCSASLLLPIIACTAGVQTVRPEESTTSSQEIPGYIL